MINWLIDWLINWMNNWLISWLIALIINEILLYVMPGCGTAPLEGILWVLVCVPVHADTGFKGEQSLQ